MTKFTIKSINVNQAPRKTQLVANLIRKRSLDDALVILEHTPKRAAASFIKLLNNALAIATSSHKLKPDSLVIEEVYTTAGRSFKRAVPQRRVPKRSKLRRVLVIKKSSHIFITVSGQAKDTVKKIDKSNGTKS